MGNRLKNYLRTFFVAASFFGLVGIPAEAQSDVFATPPNRGPNSGLFPGGGQSLSNIESIDATTGNVGFAIPLASLPPGPGGFTPSVGLIYNSTIFDLTYTPVVTNLSGSWTLLPNVNVKYTSSAHAAGGGTATSIRCGLKRGPMYPQPMAVPLRTHFPHSIRTILKRIS
ncbi:MAG: hypothetical protein WBY44_00120 [Bryobacteraceae bacterium]